MTLAKKIIALSTELYESTSFQSNFHIKESVIREQIHHELGREYKTRIDNTTVEELAAYLAPSGAVKLYKKTYGGMINVFGNIKLKGHPHNFKTFVESLPSTLKLNPKASISLRTLKKHCQHIKWDLTPNLEWLRDGAKGQIKISSGDVYGIELIERLNKSTRKYTGRPKSADPARPKTMYIKDKFIAALDREYPNMNTSQQMNALLEEKFGANANKISAKEEEYDI